MRMQLLPKKEIDSQKAQQRQRDIDEGIKLTRRIDSIREVIAEEEQKLNAFRDKTTAAIIEEIKPLEEERGKLKKEISELVSDRNQLLIPLDAEWERVDKIKEEIESIKENTLNVQQKTLQDRTEASKLLAQSRAEKLHTESCEIEAENKLKGAILKTRDAEEIMEQAETARRESENHKNETLATLAEEHRKLDLRTTALEIKEKRIAEEQAEILVIRRQLQDRAETITRAINRK